MCVQVTPDPLSRMCTWAALWARQWTKYQWEFDFLSKTIQGLWFWVRTHWTSCGCVELSPPRHVLTGVHRVESTSQTAVCFNVKLVFHHRYVWVKMSMNVTLSQYWVCPLLCTRAAWTPQASVKPHVIQQDLTGVMSQTACLFQSSGAPISVGRGWGQVTVEDSPWQSGLLGLIWLPGHSVKAVRCVSAHFYM